VRLLAEKEQLAQQSQKSPIAPIYNTPFETIAIEQVQRHLDRVVSSGLLLRIYSKGLVAYKSSAEKSDRTILIGPSSSETDLVKVVTKIFRELNEIEPSASSSKDLNKNPDPKIGFPLKFITDYIQYSHVITFANSNASKEEKSNLVSKYVEAALRQEVGKGHIELVTNLQQEIFRSSPRNLKSPSPNSSPASKSSKPACSESPGSSDGKHRRTGQVPEGSTKTATPRKECHSPGGNEGKQRRSAQIPEASTKTATPKKVTHGGKVLTGKVKKSSPEKKVASNVELKAGTSTSSSEIKLPKKILKKSSPPKEKKRETGEEPSKASIDPKGIRAKDASELQFKVMKGIESMENQPVSSSKPKEALPKIKSYGKSATVSASKVRGESGVICVAPVAFATKAAQPPSTSTLTPTEGKVPSELDPSASIPITMEVKVALPHSKDDSLSSENVKRSNLPGMELEEEVSGNAVNQDPSASSNSTKQVRITLLCLYKSKVQ